MDNKNEMTQLDRIERNSLLAAKNVLSFDDVKLLTNLSGSSLYKLTCGRLIPYYKPGGKMIYFDRIEVEDWMRKNRIATVDEIEQVATCSVATNKRRDAV